MAGGGKLLRQVLIDRGIGWGHRHRLERCCGDMERSAPGDRFEGRFDLN